MTSYAQSKDGTRIAYDVYGAGSNKPPLVYITGATCFRKFMPIVADAKVFAQEFTVYNYDRRGRGDSGDQQPWLLEREVEDIEAMIGAAGGKATLYGHSSGAVLALEAASRLVGKINKAVLYDTPYVHDAEEKAEYGQVAIKVRALLAQKKNAAAIKAFLAGIGTPKFVLFLLSLFPGWKTMKALAPTVAYDIALTEGFPPLSRFSGITIPVHVIAGQKSPVRVQAVAKQIAEAIPGSKLTIIPGQDHMVGAKVLLSELIKPIG